MTASTNITILYFASLAEYLGCEREDIELPAQISIQQLQSQLAQRNKNWQKHLLKPAIHCAINQTLVDEKAIVCDGDEVAFFPPVTGG